MSYKLIQSAGMLGVIFALITGTALAQTGTIQGTVVESKTSDPLPGVNVGIEQIGRGDVTNGKGHYEIKNVPIGTYKLTASFVGYGAKSKTVEITSGTTEEITFKLNPSTQTLSEVVVTGTAGTTQKKEIGNTIGTVDSKDIQTSSVSNVSEVLQGRIPGVQSDISNGVTGGGSRIRIRGLSSLTQSNQPIVYLDGIRIDRSGGGLQQTGVSRIDDINPSAIKSIEVLKGPSAATLYGSEASSGVIQILTKNGHSGPPQVNINIEQSAIQMPDRFAPNAGFARTQSQADSMSTYLGGKIEPYQIIKPNFTQDRFETGYGQTYSSSITGGTSVFNYFLSLRHQRENGPFKSKFDGNYPNDHPIADDKLKKTQTSLTFNVFPVDKVHIRTNIRYSINKLETYPSGNQIGAPTALSRYSKPELVAYNNSTGVPSFETVNESLENTNREDAKNFSGSLKLNYNPMDMLALDGTVGINFTNTVNTTGRPFGWNIDSYGTGNIDGIRNVNNRNYVQTTFNLKATLENQLNKKFHSKFIVGTQGTISKEHQEGVTGTHFPGPGLGVSDAGRETSISEFRQDKASLGLYGQELIGFNDYLYTTLGARLDANSAFGSEFNAQFYPKISVSFVPSDASFWNLSDKISTLRFRFAVGQSGLQPGAFDALTTYSSLSADPGPGLVPNNLGDPNLKPEVSTEYETGVDISFFEDRLSINATYWNRTTQNALINRQYAPSGGFRSPQLTNIGELKAQGVELGIDAQVINKRNLSVNLFANGAYLYQDVADLGGLPPFKASNSYARLRNFIKEGYAPSAFFGVKLLDVPDGKLPVDYNGDGKADTEEQVLNYLGKLTPQSASLPNSAGIVLRADQDGDGTYDDHYYGKPYPDWSGSFGGSFSYRNFTLNTRFQYKAGNYSINNITYQFRQASSGLGRNLPRVAKEERDFITGGVKNGTPQNSAQVRLSALKNWLNRDLSQSPFAGLNVIGQAGYLRWNELSLTYNFSNKLLKKFGARELSLTFAARNIALWTGFDGADPGANVVAHGGGDAYYDESLTTGTVGYNIPLPRRFTFKLNLKF